MFQHFTNVEKEVKWKKKKISLLATIPKNQLLNKNTTTSDRAVLWKECP